MAGLFWYSLASLIVLSQALTLDLYFPSKVDGPGACGNLVCLESYRARNTTNGRNSSAGSKQPTILHLRVFRVQPGNKRQMIAVVNRHQPRWAHGPKGSHTMGNIAAGEALLRLHFTKKEDCEAEYACESLAMDPHGYQHLRSAQLRGHSKSPATRQVGQLVKQLRRELSSVKNSLESLDSRIDHLKGSFLTNYIHFKDTAEMFRMHNQASSETFTNLVHRLSTSLENTFQKKARSFSNTMNVSAIETRNLLKKSGVQYNTTLREIRSLFAEGIRPEKCIKGMISFSRYSIIEPSKKNGYTFPFACDTETDGGGWVVFQRRKYGNVDFFRGWYEYKHGFGSLWGDFWLGNENIHSLTGGKMYELRIDLIHRGTDYFSQYDSFSLEDEKSNYALRVNGYHGTGGDSLAYYHNGRPFSTYDRDHDTAASYNCARDYHGAWWYKRCHTSNLNGKWKSKKYGVGLRWASLTDKSDPPSMSYSEMKMRLKT